MNETFATQINQSVESLFASMLERMPVGDMKHVREAYALLLRLTASSVAKLANRLGLYHIKSEQENLSFRYRCSREYAEIEAISAIAGVDEVHKVEIE